MVFTIIFTYHRWYFIDNIFIKQHTLIEKTTVRQTVLECTINYYFSIFFKTSKLVLAQLELKSMFKLISKNVLFGKLNIMQLHSTSYIKIGHFVLHLNVIMYCLNIPLKV